MDFSPKITNPNYQIGYGYSPINIQGHSNNISSLVYNNNESLNDLVNQINFQNNNKNN